MKRFSISLALVILFPAIITPCMAQSRIWHQGISKTFINVRGNPVVVGELNINVPESGNILVHFDGQCIADVGDLIVLAASNIPDWGVNDGNVGVEAANADVNRGTFSHTRMYPVSAGNHTFYAVAQNYVEQDGSGLASIYASLTVKFFPGGANQAFVRHQGINKTRLNVRGSDVVVGQQTIQTTVSGYVLVRFDGQCIADVGDLIVLAASNTPTWGVNDGNVSVEAVDADINSGSFSHSRMYPVSTGNHTFYAIAQNYVEEDGSGVASIYGSLTVEFFPGTGSAFVRHQGISQTFINVRGSAVTVGGHFITTTVPGKVVAHFDGSCTADVGDRIVLAASNIPNWGVNDGAVGVEAVNSDQNRHSFSHTRVYNVPAGSHNYYAVAHNYVEEAGSGITSIYASLTVEFFPDVTNEVLDSHEMLTDYTLAQNYPNPFNPSTTIKYSLRTTSYVTLRIFNLLGEEIRTLVNQQESFGAKEVIWNGKDNEGNLVPSGVYIYSLKAREYHENRKMILIK